MSRHTKHHDGIYRPCIGCADFDAGASMLAFSVKLVQHVLQDLSTALEVSGFFVVIAHFLCLWCVDEALHIMFVLLHAREVRKCCLVRSWTFWIECSAIELGRIGEQNRRRLDVYNQKPINCRYQEAQLIFHLCCMYSVCALYVACMLHECCTHVCHCMNFAWMLHVRIMHACCIYYVVCGM